MPVFVLILNKCDEPSVSSAISSLKLDDFCRENDITAWFGASAKDGENVDNALEAMVAEELLPKVEGATLYDVGPLVTARTDLHARDCLHFHALPGSRVGVFKWWIPMLLDYVTEMRRPGAPPMNYSSARRSQNLGFNAWRAALRERAATSNGSSV